MFYLSLTVCVCLCVVKRKWTSTCMHISIVYAVLLSTYQLHIEYNLIIANQYQMFTKMCFKRSGAVVAVFESDLKNDRELSFYWFIPFTWSRRSFHDVEIFKAFLFFTRKERVSAFTEILSFSLLLEISLSFPNWNNVMNGKIRTEKLIFHFCAFFSFQVMKNKNNN